MPSRSIRSAGWIVVRQIEVVRIFGAKSVPQRIGATIVLDLHPRALSDNQPSRVNGVCDRTGYRDRQTWAFMGGWGA